MSTKSFKSEFQGAKGSPWRTQGLLATRTTPKTFPNHNIRRDACLFPDRFSVHQGVLFAPVGFCLLLERLGVSCNRVLATRLRLLWAVTTSLLGHLLERLGVSWVLLWVILYTFVRI